MIPDHTRGRIAYELTKRLVIDMPTARAIVDAACAEGKRVRCGYCSGKGNVTSDYYVTTGCPRCAGRGWKEV